MKASIIAAGIAATVWLLLAVIGSSIFNGVVSQHVPGYPNSGQTIWLVGWPLVTVALLVSGALLCKAINRGAVLLGWLAALSFVAILPWLFGLGGGV